jgi:hypothetical protein
MHKKKKAMKLIKHFAILFTLILAGCSYRWSEKGHDGLTYEEIAPYCKERAWQAAEAQLPTPYDRAAGPAGVPVDSREDIASRSMAACLQNNGFERIRTN